MRRGHLETCLARHDNEVNSAYAKYVNVSRKISKAAEGVFLVYETTYVRYRNDTGSPKKIRSWNNLDSGLLPESFSSSDKNLLKETVKTSVNEGMPSINEHEINCKIIPAEGVEALMRRWESDWEEEGFIALVPPNGMCVVEMTREFYIPEGEEIKYKWNKVRSECNYSVVYDGDDFVPEIAVIGCDLCEASRDRVGCSVCDHESGRLVKNDGRTKTVSIKNWPKPNMGIKVTWRKPSSQTQENMR